MKKIQLIYLVFCGTLLLASCKKDNYDMPDGIITGALVDAQTNGPLELSENGNNGNGNSVVRMWVDNPSKYPAPANYDLAINQDGTFTNSTVFAEKYKVFPVGQSGPWQWLANDTAKITVNSRQTTNVTFKVAPFFYISKPTVTDSTVTFTVTKSTVATVTNNLSNSNNLLILINNFNRVDANICSNGPGNYYQNRWQYTVTNAILGTPYTPSAGTTPGGQTYSFSFANMHLPKGTYYLRVAIFGSGSNGKFNYSPIVQIKL